MAAKQVKLDALGEQTEKTLMAMLDEVSKKQPENIPPEQRVTMLEKLRVIDRVLKWQAIKLKADDDEGDFFNFADDQDEEPDERPKGKGARNGRTAEDVG